MFQAFVITLREGLEAFLIVAISLAYLRKSGRQELVPAVHWGIGLSVLISIGAAVLFQRAANHALWEGLLAVTAAVLVTSLTVHMWLTARRIKSDRFLTDDYRPEVYTQTGIDWVENNGMREVLLRHAPSLGSILADVRNSFFPWPRSQS